LACPFFMPTEKYESGPWIHPARLPLGAGWKGYCTAAGHENAIPAQEQIHESCNLGYPVSCPWRPVELVWDSVRFAVTKECEQRIVLCYVCEKGHLPISHGLLEYDTRLGGWTSTHAHSGIQKMADCYLKSYLLRKGAAASISSDPA
jgi:hypothetical protein